MSFLKDIIEKRELDLRKRELEVDYAERNIELRFKEIDLNVKQRAASYEHEYHDAKEIKNTELAKLDALIEAKKDTLNMHVNMLQDLNVDKNKTIFLLQAIIENMSKNMVMNTKIEVIK